ncbi:MAG: hypothetical protein JRH20_06340 [Deltaproteobacteria bacterium]|nr:hypothetical protein [Deltaproteobacteria bacterium]
MVTGRGARAAKELLTDILAPIAFCFTAAVSCVQQLVGLEGAGRKLSPEEIERLRPIFGKSIDYSAVCIKEGKSFALTLSDRAWVRGNTIYAPLGKLPPATLAHEMTHIWQYQHQGARYMMRALDAQYLGDGYNLGRGLAEGRSFSQLNAEQQAVLVEQAVKQGFLAGETTKLIIDGVDRSAELSDALNHIRHAGHDAAKPQEPPNHHERKSFHWGSSR